MEKPTIERFERDFRELKGHPPFRWQKRLFLKFMKGKIPNCVNIPTGCGKTAIMAVWLIALAHQARRGGLLLPRRLIWIVNRRVVVDQATDEAIEIINRLEEREELRALKEALRELSLASGRTVEVSTLRGELAERPEWKHDPSRPAIVVGTVDMVGSRLLFCGYGDGKWHRPYHAGLLTVDTLIVHDESHLTPSFRDLLEEIKKLNPASLKPFHIMHLSAVHGRAIGEVFGLAEEDTDLSQRTQAKKILYLHTSPEGIEKLCELALAHEGKRHKVLIYVQSPNTALSVFNKIRKEVNDRVAVLTGTLRGYERDKLEGGPLFSIFKTPGELRGDSVYLVSTSAGEVGVNLDADHCVSDLAPVGSLVQRFGRVNRFGLGEARIDLVYNEEKVRKERDPLSSSLAATLHYLRSLPMERGFNVCPMIFYEIPPPFEAFPPEPLRPQLSPFLIDDWSMTSVDASKWPQRPEVHAWLHGAEEEEETYFVWREDVSWLASEEVERERCERVISAYPVRARERLRASTRDAARFLQKLLRRVKARVTIVKPDGEIWRGDLSDSPAQRLAYSTIFLPCDTGGLREGLLDPTAEEHVSDVADLGEERCRFHVKVEGKEWVVRRIVPESEPLRVPVDRSWEDELRREGIRILVKVPIRREEEPSEFLVYAGPAEEGLDFLPAPSEEGLREHGDRVGEIALKLSAKAGLLEDVRSALKSAGLLHDSGKEKWRWQLAIGNHDFSHPLAKSSRAGFDHRYTGGYRHEFGSLMDAKKKGEPDMVLHLIGSSHGFARPFFPPRAYDPDLAVEECDEVNRRTGCRFASLQRRLGWWNLAYLEALLKAADRLASFAAEVRS